MIALSSAHAAARFLWPEFEERNGVIVHSGVPTPDLARFQSASEAEAFYSHTHILLEFRHAIRDVPHPELEDTWIPDSTHPQFALAWSLSQMTATIWLAKLRQSFPTHHFRVYCTRLADPVVRFHAVRPSERPWYTDSEAQPDVAAGDLRILEG